MRGETIDDPIVFTETHLTFAPPWIAEEIAPIFQFRNVGDAPVTLLSCKADCGCVASRTEFPFSVNPNCNGDIKFHVNLGSRQGVSKNAIEIKYAYGESKFTKIISITMELPKVYSINPSMVIWKGSEWHDSKIVHLHVNDKNKFHITSIQDARDNNNDGKSFRASFDMKNEGTDFEISITPPKVNETSISAVLIFPRFCGPVV
jgi:hypothetical protein